MSPTPTLDELVTQVRTGEKYRHISEDLIRRIAAQELANRRSLKDAVKAVRNKLHQVGGAYQETLIDYAHFLRELESLPADLRHPDMQAFCLKAMRSHASTRERLPILETFFRETLAETSPVASVLDVACGLNPLALPWMPLPSGVRYTACDIYSDQIDFLNHFFAAAGVNGQAEVCDLTTRIPDQPVDLALVLKTIPCLEQVDKTIGARLLDALPARRLLVSYPAHSLGGRSKGMVANYSAAFERLIQGRGWDVRRFEFATELAFLVTKP